MGKENLEKYLKEQQRKSSAEVAQEWANIEDLYNRKLWHQLTLKLQDFIKHPSMQANDAMIQLYHNFIVDFEHRINHLSLVEILIPVSRQIKDKKEAIEFLSKIRTEKVKSDRKAVILCLTTEGNFHLLLKEIKEVKAKIEEAAVLLEDIDGVTSIHAPYYELSSNYHKIESNHALFYREALRFLGCIDLSTLSNRDQVDRAFSIGLAAILGKEIYNFGELLQHSILDALKVSERSWLVQLLFAFNSGNIKEFKDLKVHWSKQPDLAKNEKKMEHKIRLLCLMEMTFKRPANLRVLTFDDIAKETGLSKNQVEHLIMRALSLNLVKGSIDQVSESVHMTWVQPRVLDKNQIRDMANRLQSWCNQVSLIEDLVQNRAQEILT